MILLEWKALTLWLSGLFFFPALPDKSPDLHFTPQARETYQRITALQPSRESLERLRSSEPDNAIHHYLEHLADFMEEMVHGEEPAYRSLMDEVATRSRSIRLGQPGSPWREYCLGRMHLMCAIAAYRRHERIHATRHLRAALTYIRKGQAAHPAFLPLQSDHTLLQALLASAPEGYHWALEKLTGVNPDARGLSRLAGHCRQLTQAGHFLAPEACALHLALLTHLDRRPDLALPRAEALLAEQPGQPLLRFMTAWIARERGLNDRCIVLLEALPAPERFPHAERLLGRALLCRLESPPARAAFHRFLRQWGGGSYRAETWQFIAWSHLVEGDKGRALQSLQASAREPVHHLDGDAQARRQAARRELPQAALLRARLRFDGGYHAEALREISGIPPDSLTDPERREFHYRKGRIYQAMGQFEVAGTHLSTAWQDGRGEKDHFACAAALQLGYIHLDGGRVQAARLWFDRCLAEHPEDYRHGLHQKARAGLRALP